MKKQTDTKTQINYFLTLRKLALDEIKEWTRFYEDTEETLKVLQGKKYKAPKLDKHYKK